MPSESMDAPEVSVILCTNRGGPYLEEAIDSLVSQTYENWELIVVDDGSDANAQINNAVQSLSQATVVRQENSGVCVARNVGFATSRGNFIAYLDDDDIWHPERLALQVAALDANPDAIGCHSSFTYIDGIGREIASRSITQGTSDDYLSGRESLPLFGTMLFRRTVIQRVGPFLPSFRLSEDVEFLFRVVREGPIVALPNQLFAYRRYPGNTTKVNVDHLMELSDLRCRTLQIWGAEARRDPRERQLLTENLRQQRSTIARAQVRRIAFNFRLGRCRDAIKELGWGLRIVPRELLAQAGALAMAKVAKRDLE